MKARKTKVKKVDPWQSKNGKKSHEARLAKLGKKGYSAQMSAIALKRHHDARLAREHEMSNDDE